MDWLRDYDWQAWLGLAMLLGMAEMFSLDLVLLMLAVGALVGMTTALVGGPLVLQILLAAGASVAMLALVRPSVVKRLHGGPDLKHGHELLIGVEGYALSEITDQSGQVKISGEVWTARPYDPNVVIAPGAKIEVFEIKGATAYVHEIPQLGT